MADLYVTLIRSGANLGDAFIPDISVGIHWGKHWTANNLDAVYGVREKYDHNYPAYFPQSASNPQSPYCYPDEALAEFRDWFRKEYINKKMPTYLLGKVKDGHITAPAATAAIEAFTPKQIMPPQIRPNASKSLRLNILKPALTGGFFFAQKKRPERHRSTGAVKVGAGSRDSTGRLTIPSARRSRECSHFPPALALIHFLRTSRAFPSFSGC